MKTLLVVAVVMLAGFVSTADADTIYAASRYKIWEIDTTAATASQIGTHAGGMLESMAIRPGGVTTGVVGGYDGTLYPVDVSTGATSATLGGNAPEVQALAYAPDGQLWGYQDLSGADQLIKLDDTNGIKTNVGGRPGRINAMVFIGATAYCWVEGTGLHTVNLTTGAITDVNGAAGGTNMTGMAMGPNDGILYAGSGSGDLFSVDIGTGVEALLGNLALGEVLEGMSSVENIPEPVTMSLLALGGLGVLLKRRRR